MAKGNLQRCLQVVFRWEGGFVNHPKDPGGPTKFGITQATLSHELGRRASISDVQALTLAMACQIYRKKYWNLIEGEALSLGVDLIALDIAVNSGPGRALSWLKKTEALSPLDRIKALHRRRLGFWRGLKAYATFGNGWENRERDVFSTALKMAGG